MSSDGVFAPGAMLAGKYRIERLLGQGGMGAVYLAENTDIGRKVAVKVLRPEMATQPEALARFKQEARNAASVGHPGIVEILDLGSLDDGGAFIVMEALDGETLRERLQRAGTLSPHDGAFILSQVLDTLAVAHDKGVIHRDLKPDNIFLVERPTPGTRILDFGISKLTGASDVGLTRTGAVMGTPLYMSPEQASGAKGIGPATDLYSVGAILYEALSGQPPFPGETYGEVLSKVLTQQQRPVDALRPDVPRDLSNLIEELLRKDAAQRPPDARAVTQRLRQQQSLTVPDYSHAPAPAPLPLNTPAPGPGGSHDTLPFTGMKPAAVAPPAAASPARPPPAAASPARPSPAASSGSGGKGILILGLFVSLGLIGGGIWWVVSGSKASAPEGPLGPNGTPAGPAAPTSSSRPSVPAVPAGPPHSAVPAICSKQPCQLYAATQHRLYLMDALLPAAPRYRCDFGGALNPKSEVNDVAVSPDGQLYGITADALYSIDWHTCAATRVMAVPQKLAFNGLSWLRGNELVAADPTGALFTIDLVTGQVKPAGSVGMGLACSGDLVATADGVFVAARDPSRPATEPDILVQLDSDLHFKRRIAPLPGPNFYALAFWGGSLYAMDKGGRVFAVDATNGSAHSLGVVPGADFYGAASTPSAPAR